MDLVSCHFCGRETDYFCDGCEKPICKMCWNKTGRYYLCDKCVKDYICYNCGYAEINIYTCDNCGKLICKECRVKEGKYDLCPKCSR